MGDPDLGSLDVTERDGALLYLLSGLIQLARDHPKVGEKSLVLAIESLIALGVTAEEIMVATDRFPPLNALAQHESEVRHSEKNKSD